MSASQIISVNTLFANSDPLIVSTLLTVDPTAPVEGAIAWLYAGFPDQGVASSTAEQVTGSGAGGSADAADTPRSTSRIYPGIRFAKAWGPDEGHDIEVGGHFIFICCTMILYYVYFIEVF